ncbi:MAG: Do family serine endopeptidase [Candidatus Eiseniibacteriota bacterium]|jgi:serine protease Do
MLRYKLERTATVVAVLLTILVVARPAGSQPAAIADPSGGVTEESVTTARQLADGLSAAFEHASEAVGPSVVPIFAEAVVSKQAGPPTLMLPHGLFGDDFFRRFFGAVPDGGAPRTVHSLGSGVVVSEDGYILTNNHVVDGASKLTVVLEDGSKHEARVVGTDPPSDLAVIQVDAEDLHPARLGDSEAIKVGQWVIAVGNPYQLLHTVTAGIISARGRSSIGLADYEDFIQTDASINPGNSGGALANLDGEVIGINTAISSPSGGNVGIGFAIPISMAHGIMEQLVENGSVSRGYLGLMPQDIDPALASALGLDTTRGVLVGDVPDEGPAAEAGMRRGDVILTYDGKTVDNSVHLRQLVADTAPGTTVTVGILRDGKEREIDIAVGHRPDEGQAATPHAAGSSGTREQLGLDLQTLTEDLARQLGVDLHQGALVTGTRPGGPADEAGVRRGDVIEELDRQPVTSAADFDRIAAKLEPGQEVAVLIHRGQSSRYMAMSVPE